MQFLRRRRLDVVNGTTNETSTVKLAIRPCESCIAEKVDPTFHLDEYFKYNRKNGEIL